MKPLNRSLFSVMLLFAALPAYSQVVVNACGCEDKALPLVYATVNNVKITRADISPEVETEIKTLQQGVIDARRIAVNLQINGRLLAAEAKKRGLTPNKVLQDETVAKVAEPTEAEAQAYFDKNKGDSKLEFRDTKDSIISYLRENRRIELTSKLAESLRARAQLKIVTTTDATPPANDLERARVFATLNGENITSGDIEDSLRPLIFSVQEQVYTLLKKDVELKINTLLLTEEAKKRGITPSVLLDTEVTAKLKPVTDAEAEKFYSENKTQANVEFAKVKPQVIQYLTDRAAGNAEKAYAEQLRRASKVETFLTPPEPPTYEIAIDDQPLKGNPNATVTLVEFTDFQCPNCALQEPIIERLIGEYGSRVRFVIRDYPLSMHENAFKAAEAAEAAREQGKYWEYAALLFRNQSALQVDKLKAYATELKLDRTKFDAALDAGKFRDKVQRDLLDGDKAGVGATPTIFVNGKNISNRSYEGLKAAIETSLKNP